MDKIFVLLVLSMMSSNRNIDVSSIVATSNMQNKEEYREEYITAETQIAIEEIVPEEIDYIDYAITVPANYKMPYYIKVNNSQNVVNVYERNQDGDIYLPYKTMLCSIGTSTPKSGSKYKVTNYRKRWNALKGGVYGQYAVQIVGNILFHSVPYTTTKNSALE